MCEVFLCFGISYLFLCVSVCVCVYKLGHDILNDTEHKLIYTTNIYKYMYIFMI